jgi:RNA polymerase sigma factor (sigma-70 family)
LKNRCYLSHAAPIIQVMKGDELLSVYREQGSEEAFAELVGRYTNLVYSVAVRRLGNGALAEEVAQVVFTRLARTTPNLRSDATLLAWLHRTTLHVAIDVWRSETRRRAREQRTVTMQPADAETDSLWNEAAPLLDETLNRLNAADREVLLLRFFDGKPMRDVAALLRVSEDAAKMRVHRAVDRLRTLLARRGVACTACALGALLGSRAVEAAPASLAMRLSAVSLVHAPATSPLAGMVEMLLRMPRERLMLGGAALATVAVSVGLLLRSNVGEETASHETILESAPLASGVPMADEAWIQPAMNLTEIGNAMDPLDVRLIFRVVDAISGDGLAGVSVRAAYFYAGGRGVAHEQSTGPDGRVVIPEPLEPNDRGMNVFARVEGYVPKVVGFFGQSWPVEYVLPLERARVLSGTVVDEDGWPVSDVQIPAQRADDHEHGAANIDFQRAVVTTDADGHWVYSYVPSHYEEVKLILTHEAYAVTLPTVPMTSTDLLNLVLVIDRGFDVAGRVTDWQGRPVAGATVTEVVSTGYRRITSTTDPDGRFLLRGVWSRPEAWQTRPPEADEFGWTRFRGLAEIGEPLMDLAVQADGLAPEVRRIALRERTTVADITLQPGHILRGQVLDDSGVPMPNVVVRTDTDDGIRQFEWRTQTDAEGRFEWRSAPADPVLFWFEAESAHDVLRKIPLQADGTEYQVTLRRIAP